MTNPDRALAQHQETDEPRTIADLPEAVAGRPALQPLADVPIPAPTKEAVDEDDLVHRDFDDTPFWQRIPAFADVDRGTFLQTSFQLRHGVTGAAELRELVGPLVDEAFLADVERGLAEAPMNVRVTPYLLGLIDWDDPYGDPIRIQFLPVASTRRPDHPRLALDSLHEQEDSPTPGLVHRYPDKALFLPLDVCPVYCRFCTRSYAVGGSTGTVAKDGYKPADRRWQAAFAYLAARPEIEDVVVSGGDAYMLPARRLREILTVLLDIPHIRRVRIATKGPAVMPMKILTDTAWTDTLCALVDAGRARGKEVCLHTHFNCMEEITAISREAMDLLFRRGVTVRNQSVLIRGVNDDADRMANLVRQLSWMNVQPYYVYQHDMVKGVEELRTRLEDSMEIERRVRGVTAGFNTPTFVTDVPGGGGKRDLHSFEFYDEITGVSVYRSPAVDPDKAYLYFDPIGLLPDAGRERWARPAEHARIVKEALLAAGLPGRRVATA
ncbi:MAG: KamA family radical SAM protein [Krumholzibacteria bacterium]|nr:KamA family radical SAM protein [Candidatus Krumholzibacteria bacterium]